MAATTNIAYIRVSTIEQNEGRQLEMMKPYNIDKTYIEKLSGKDMDRPQLKAMIDYGNVLFRNDKKLKLLIIVGTHSKIIHLSAVINKLRK